MPVPYCIQQYKCRLVNANSKAVYADSPYFTYGLGVEVSLYDADEEEAAVSTSTKVTGVTASDKTYAAKIVVQWDALAGASLYQVYASNSHTRPTAVEQQASHPYVSTSDNCLIAEIIAVDFDSAPYTCLAITHGETYEGIGAKFAYATGAVLAAGLHRFYWVRAKVSNDNSGEEWGDFSEMAHGVVTPAN